MLQKTNLVLHECFTREQLTVTQYLIEQSTGTFLATMGVQQPLGTSSTELEVPGLLTSTYP